MRQILAALALIALCTGSAVPAQANCNQAMAFANKVGQQVTDTVANTSLSPGQRLQQFARIFKANADFPTMARVALGRWWQKLPQSQRGEYFNLVEKLIVQVMFGRLNDFAGERYSIQSQSCTPRGSGGNQFLVDGPVIKAGGGPVTNVRWWLVNRGGGLKVVDVSIAGISLTLQKREEFEDYILKSGRSIGPLLDDLRRRVGG